MQVDPSVSLSELRAGYRAACATSNAIVEAIGDADAPVRARGTGRDLRWAMLAVIEETARHAGHADIIRESIDGATGIELLAGAEGWPESPWLTPWRPKETI
jgi:hypothetical protein